jgi:hypothetical protein
MDLGAVVLHYTTIHPLFIFFVRFLFTKDSCPGKARKNTLQPSRNQNHRKKIMSTEITKKHEKENQRIFRAFRTTIRQFRVFDARFLE